MSSNQRGKKLGCARQEVRRQECVQNLAVNYEGSDEEITLHAPDLTPKGMFINTPNHLPEGAVLRVTFQLPRSRYQVQARGEVRYCLPGVGVGIEFVEISPQARQAIEKEIHAYELSPALRT
jgi:PilZ domain-containing protein